MNAKMSDFDFILILNRIRPKLNKYAKLPIKLLERAQSAYSPLGDKVFHAKGIQARSVSDGFSIILKFDRQILVLAGRLPSNTFWPEVNMCVKRRCLKQANLKKQRKRCFYL